MRLPALLAIGSLVLSVASGAASAADMPAGPIADVTFQCNLGKTIHAAFYPDSVDLTLSDGRAMTLPQTMSGSGARYANSGETIVFWNKGNTAFITEGATDTYSGCIQISDAVPDPSWLTFASSQSGFSLRYPPGYTVNGGYVYEGLGPGHDITGVSFTIPASKTTGTNLASDTRVSVETLPGVADCTADLFLPAGGPAPTTVTENGTEYSVATMSDAGAGNFYDTTVYALVGSSPCLAVRTFIHYNNAANFDPPVTGFDRAALTAEFDAIRKTLVIGQ